MPRGILLLFWDLFANFCKCLRYYIKTAYHIEAVKKLSSEMLVKLKFVIFLMVCMLLIIKLPSMVSLLDICLIALFSGSSNTISSDI